MTANGREDSRRVVLLPPTPRDAEITARVLGERSIESVACGQVSQACAELARGAGAFLIAEEHLLGKEGRLLQHFLDSQPSWSDVPILVLTIPSSVRSKQLYAWRQRANVTLFNRPLEMFAFISAIESALRDRARQYQIRDLLAVEESRRREFQQLADAMPQMVLTTDPTGRVEYLNERGRQYFGLDPRAFAGRLWLDLLNTEDRAEAQVRWDTALARGSAYECEVRLRESPTGETRWHLARAVPIINQRGKLRNWFGTLTDIQEQKAIEEKLHGTLRQAEIASAAKSEFLANMSHEIRTPMTSVLGYTELLRRTERDEEKLASLAVIQRNGNFLLELINDILDLSKIEADKLEVHSEPLDLVEFLTEVEGLMRVRAEEKSIDFSFDYETKLPRVIRTDRRRVRQVLVNLIGNAIKFTPDGRVDVRVGLVVDRLCFTVTDTGIGMSPSQVAQLFQPFHQAESSISRDFGGTGLGLAISRRLAAILGGDITVESALDEGSRFTFSFPPAELGEVAKLAQAPRADEHGGLARPADGLNCSVLVVEDRRDIQFLAGRVLQQAGASVEFAENGLEATHYVREQLRRDTPPDVVLMDMQMPVMDGLSATIKLREFGYQGSIVALTADAMHGDREKCLEAGCDSYISKPIDTTELIDELKKLTSKQAC